MSRHSVVLDRGREPLTYYPVKYVTDRLGNTMKQPDMENGRTVLVTCSTDRQTTAELPGQVDVSVVKISLRIMDIESWSLVIFRNEEWDLAPPPVISRMTRATEHMALILRSRNRRAP